MGRLLYEGAGLFTADDRALRHLHLVIHRKLRQGHAFAIHWRMPAEAGSGHGSAWISPGIEVAFEYAAPVDWRINQEWLRALLREADGAGLRLVAEPQTVDETHVNAED